MSWDPGRYLVFQEERERPALDLLARIPEGVFRAVDPMGFFFIILGSCDQFFSRRGTMAHVFGVDDVSEEVSAAICRR